MAKPNGLAKVSGDLLKNKEVLHFLAEKSREFSLAILPGGGGQITKAFKKKGFKRSKYTPMGRVTDSLEKRQLARDVLEINQANVQDAIDYLDINARVIIPVLYIATVLCHVNGDIYALAAYNGFDKIFIITTKDRAEAKREWLKQLAKCFEHIEKGELEKIEVVGF